MHGVLRRVEWHLSVAQMTASEQMQAHGEQLERHRCAYNSVTTDTVQLIASWRYLCPQC